MRHRLVQVQVCFDFFNVYYISFLPASVADNSIKRICVSGWFVFPVGLQNSGKKAAAHPKLTFMFDNILKTF